MKFKDYINYQIPIINEDTMTPLVESTETSDIPLSFEVPMMKKQKFKKLNKKTNRMKFSRKTRFLKTDIHPKDRHFKNLPRYANKKPKVRFQDWLGLQSDSDFSRKGASGGKSTNGKWYGYSHRAVYGFEPGMEVKKGHVAIKPGRNLPYTIKNDADAKWHAIEFSRQVS